MNLDHSCELNYKCGSYVEGKVHIYLHILFLRDITNSFDIQEIFSTNSEVQPDYLNYYYHH